MKKKAATAVDILKNTRSLRVAASIIGFTHGRNMIECGVDQCEHEEWKFYVNPDKSLCLSCGTTWADMVKRQHYESSAR